MDNEFFHPNPEQPIQEGRTPLPTPESSTISADVFLLNPKNKTFVEGKTHRPVSPVSGFTLVVLFAFAVGGIAALVMVLREWVVVVQLSAYGESTAGLVVDHRTESGEDSTTYYITFRYVIDDRLYIQEQAVGESAYDQFANSSRVVVRYFPADPNIARLTEPDTDTVGHNVLITLSIVVLNTFMWWKVRGTIKKNRRYQQLGREGRMVTGEVLRSEGHKDEDGYIVTMHYCFQSPSGRPLLGKVSRTRNDLKRKPLPEPGTPLVVLYLDDTSYELL